MTQKSPVQERITADTQLSPPSRFPAGHLQPITLIGSVGILAALSGRDARAPRKWQVGSERLRFMVALHTP